MDFILNRMREASTWRSLIWVLSSFGVFHFSGDQASSIVALAMCLAGATGVVTPDRLFDKQPKASKPTNK